MKIKKKIAELLFLKKVNSITLVLQQKLVYILFMKIMKILITHIIIK